MNREPILVFGGSGSPKLTKKICAHLKVAPGKNEVVRFSEGNLFVHIRENVRGRNIYLVQQIAFPSNDNFVELLFWIDAFKRASAASITVVIPYFSYAKGDKKDEPRVSIRARVCMDAIENTGANRLVMMDLHAPQIQGFARIPVDELQAMPTLCDVIKRQRLKNLTVVSPDAGFAKKARNFASRLRCPLAIADKMRSAHDEHAEVMSIIGDVRNRTCLIVDDFTISGGTLAESAQRLLDKGAKEVYAAITHGVFARGSMEKIAASPLKRLFVTDTVENQPVSYSRKIEVISVAPLLAEAVRRIHNRESISVLFP
jgi:ribose-phosphate pyrophosphokinase